MRKKKLYFLLQGKLLLLLLSFSNLTQAQVVPDDTLPQNSVVNSDCTTSCQIDGGTTRNSNLFHSFKEFSVPENGEAVFNNSTQIENIFTRVTGSSISNINGTIGAHGSANLFLINPNGIMFGANARLDIGGSFLATTADSIFFKDNSQFSATNPQSSPLLTVSVPIGLQFGETPGEIVNQSRFEEPPSSILSDEGEPVGIKVDDGNTIALVSSGIKLNNGFLTAREGRIELGSVGANSFVDLIQNSESFSLSYDSVNEFARISITNNSRINTDTATNSSSGDIQIHGSAIKLLNDSSVTSINDSESDGGKILINADTLTVKDSRVVTETQGNGGGGNLTIKSNSIDLIQENKQTILSTGTGLFPGFSGEAGDLTIKTERLTIQDGAQISVSTFGSGEGGNLIVKASESIEVIGISEDGEFASGLFAQSVGENATGDAGILQIDTGKLIVRDGGRISVGAVESDDPNISGVSKGNGGELVINATESIEVSGFGFDEKGEKVPSTLLSESQGIGDAGNLDITTPKLIVTNQGEVNVSAIGTGEAGILTVDAQEIILNNGRLNAKTNAGDRGNITINNADTLILRNDSEITTNAQGDATGGNITIDSEGIAILDNSNITANAEKGEGGNIEINTQRLFQEPGSLITATSEENIDGVININSPDIDPTSDLFELTYVPIDAEEIFDQNLCKFEDGKIAKGSSFIITGRGGLTPTSSDPLDNQDRVVNWANRDDIQVSKNGIVAVRQREVSDTSEKTYPVIQQAQGWVTTSDGSVWLVADSPETLVQNSKMEHPDCRTLRQANILDAK